MNGTERHRTVWAAFAERSERPATNKPVSCTETGPHTTSVECPWCGSHLTGPALPVTNMKGEQTAWVFMCGRCHYTFRRAVDKYNPSKRYATGKPAKRHRSKRSSRPPKVQAPAEDF